MSDYSHAIASHFACAYRVTYPGATQEPCESSWGHTLIFHAVPPANTLVRWVNENAFASVVQARPYPTFGRPVRQRMAPSTTARHFSTNPSDPTSRWTPCPPKLSPRPARHCPRFWIWLPPSESQRDSNPPDQCAAQHTLQTHPPPSRLQLTSRFSRL